MKPYRATEPETPFVSRRACDRLVLLSLVALAAAAFAGCGGSGDLPLDQVDPDAVPANPTYDQVFAVLDNKCVMCHTGGDEGEDEGGYATATAGDTEPDLSDCAQIVAQRFDILDQVVANTMPPGAMPRLTSEQKLLISRWVENGAPAPCN
jgi:uncharacterized membrane protein